MLVSQITIVQCDYCATRIHIEHGVSLSGGWLFNNAYALTNWKNPYCQLLRTYLYLCPKCYYHFKIINALLPFRLIGRTEP